MKPKEPPLGEAKLNALMPMLGGEGQEEEP